MSTTEAKAHCCVICSYPAPNKCSACGKAFYCSKGACRDTPPICRQLTSTARQSTRKRYVCANQVLCCCLTRRAQAWAKHKRLCKIFQRQARGEAVPADSYCGLCGKADGPLTKTDCCDRTVCDDAASYVRVSLV